MIKGLPLHPMPNLTRATAAVERDHSVSLGAERVPLSRARALPTPRYDSTWSCATSTPSMR